MTDLPVSLARTFSNTAGVDELEGRLSDFGLTVRAVEIPRFLEGQLLEYGGL